MADPAQRDAPHKKLPPINTDLSSVFDDLSVKGSPLVSRFPDGLRNKRHSLDCQRHRDGAPAQSPSSGTFPGHAINTPTGPKAMQRRSWIADSYRPNYRDSPREQSPRDRSPDGRSPHRETPRRWSREHSHSAHPTSSKHHYHSHYRQPVRTESPVAYQERSLSPKDRQGHSHTPASAAAGHGITQQISTLPASVEEGINDEEKTIVTSPSLPSKCTAAWYIMMKDKQAKDSYSINEHDRRFLERMDRLQQKSTQKSAAARGQMAETEKEIDPVIPFTVTEDMKRELSTPTWYRRLELQATPCIEHRTNRLRQISDLVNEIIVTGEDSRAARKLRSLLHDARMFEVDSPEWLKLAGVLDQTGLPEVVLTESVPWDIRSDAMELFGLWKEQTLCGDIMYGITTSSDGRRTQTLDAQYKRRRAFARIGSNGLQNGQWWPTQLCTIRDGAHGNTQAGISGTVHEGAFSVVIAAASAKYKECDDDHGDWLWFAGTASKTDEDSNGTKILELSYSRAKPIRVLRSAGHSKNRNGYSPEVGIRYDGLYHIKAMKYAKDPITKINVHPPQKLFKLVRDDNQTPIRYSGVERRPTEQETRAYNGWRSDHSKTGFRIG